MQSKHGFTLIELLVVISIISLLSSIVFSSLGLAREKATKAGGQQFDGQMYRSLGDDPIALWSFNDGSGSIAVDRSGNGNDLSLSGNFSWAGSANSVYGANALNFTSTNGLSGGSGILTGIKQGPLKQSEGSFSYWLNVKSLSPWGMVFTISGANNWNWYNAIYPDQNTAIIHWYTANGVGGFLSYLASPSSLVGKWTHVAVTWYKPGVAAGTINLYVNGKLVVSKSDYTLQSGSSDCGTSCPVNIGFQNGNTSRYINAYVDEFRLFSRTLLASEVHQLYALGASNHGLSINK